MTGKRSPYGTEDFKVTQFAYHGDGRIAMRSSRFPVDPWEGSDGIRRSDTGMNKEGFRPLPNLADALIAQQQTMQASLDEAVREVSERAWNEGVVSVQKPLQECQSFAGRLAIQSVVAAQVKFGNPYREGDA